MDATKTPCTLQAYVRAALRVSTVMVACVCRRTVHLKATLRCGQRPDTQRLLPMLLLQEADNAAQKEENVAKLKDFFHNKETCKSCP